MKMYRVNLFLDATIEEKEVVRVSEKSVWFERIRHDGKTVTERELKSSSYYKWFDTFADADLYIIESLASKILAAKAVLKKTENDFLSYKSQKAKQ